jgi:pimeloyl-ACP methyl ester carboxylesterase
MKNRKHFTFRGRWKKAVSTLVVAIVSLTASGQDIAGQWHGVLKISNVQLHLVVNIRQAENGYTATMDSPDQGAKDIPVSAVSFDGATLKLSVAIIGAEYEGVLDADGNIAGTFRQGMSLPLTLSRGKAGEGKVLRPQNPARPYPYREETVAFSNPEAGVKLAGTLTLPTGDGLSPAVVLISGSGAHNRDEEIMEHRPFLVLADFLTRNGIAVLRYDDRGAGASTGNYAAATSADFAGDAASAVKYLLTRREINARKIGLIGHSEGGMLAAMVAAQSGDVAFLVSMAGTGIPGDELLALQQERIAVASGGDLNDIQKAFRINKGLYEIIKKTAAEDQLKPALAGYLEQALKEIPDTVRAKSGYDDDFIRASVDHLTSPWMQYYIRYDPAPAWEKVQCPVLAVNGDRDLQVPSDVNLAAIGRALSAGGNRGATIRELPGLNHLFQECETGLPTEYAAIAQTLSPVALKEILQWILALP